MCLTFFNVVQLWKTSTNVGYVFFVEKTVPAGIRDSTRKVLGLSSGNLLMVSGSWLMAQGSPSRAPFEP